MSHAFEDEMRDDIVSLLRPYASRIELFGSAARGEAEPGSDVDLLVTLRPDGERPPLGLKWFALEEEVAERLGRPVEIVTERALPIREEISEPRFRLRLCSVPI